MQVNFSFDLRTNRSDCDWLLVTADLGSQRQKCRPSTDAKTIEFSIADNAAHHRFSLLLEGKRRQDTDLAEDGTIVDDLIVIADNFMLDGIRIDNLVRETAVYRHDLNGNLATVQDHKFYNQLGCNGQLIFEFTTPAYLWLLERM